MDKLFHDNYAIEIFTMALRNVRSGGATILSAADIARICRAEGWQRTGRRVLDRMLAFPRVDTEQQRAPLTLADMHTAALVGKVAQMRLSQLSYDKRSYADADAELCDFLDDDQIFIDGGGI